MDYSGGWSRWSENKVHVEGEGFWVRCWTHKQDPEGCWSLWLLAFSPFGKSYSSSSWTISTSSTGMSTQKKKNKSVSFQVSTHFASSGCVNYPPFYAIKLLKQKCTLSTHFFLTKLSTHLKMFFWSVL